MHQLLSFQGSHKFLIRATRGPLSPAASEHRRSSSKMNELRKEVISTIPCLCHSYDLLLEQCNNNETELLSAIQHLLPPNFSVPSNGSPQQGGETKINFQPLHQPEQSTFYQSDSTGLGRKKLRAEFPHTLDLYLEVTQRSSVPPAATRQPAAPTNGPTFSAWECSGCYSDCNADEMWCPCCNTLQPGRTQAEVDAAKAAASGGGGGGGGGGITFGTQPASSVTFGTQPAGGVTFGTQPASGVTFGTQPVGETKIDTNTKSNTGSNPQPPKSTRDREHYRSITSDYLDLYKELLTRDTRSKKTLRAHMKELFEKNGIPNKEQLLSKLDIFRTENPSLAQKICATNKLTMYSADSPMPPPARPRSMAEHSSPTQNEHKGSSSALRQKVMHQFGASNVDLLLEARAQVGNVAWEDKFGIKMNEDGNGDGNEEASGNSESKTSFVASFSTAAAPSSSSTPAPAVSALRQQVIDRFGASNADLLLEARARVGDKVWAGKCGIGLDDGIEQHEPTTSNSTSNAATAAATIPSFGTQPAPASGVTFVPTFGTQPAAGVSFGTQLDSGVTVGTQPAAPTVSTTNSNVGNVPFASFGNSLTQPLAAMANDSKKSNNGPEITPDSTAMAKITYFYTKYAPQKLALLPKIAI